MRNRGSISWRARDFTIMQNFPNGTGTHKGDSAVVSGNTMDA